MTDSTRAGCRLNGHLNDVFRSFLKKKQLGQSEGLREILNDYFLAPMDDHSTYEQVLSEKDSQIDSLKKTIEKQKKTIAKQGKTTTKQNKTGEDPVEKELKMINDLSDVLNEEYRKEVSSLEETICIMVGRNNRLSKEVFRLEKTQNFFSFFPVMAIFCFSLLLAYNHLLSNTLPSQRHIMYHYSLAYLESKWDGDAPLRPIKKELYHSDSVKISPKQVLETLQWNKQYSNAVFMAARDGVFFLILGLGILWFRRLLVRNKIKEVIADNTVEV